MESLVGCKKSKAPQKYLINNSCEFAINNSCEFIFLSINKMSAAIRVGLLLSHLKRAKSVPVVFYHDNVSKIKKVQEHLL